MENKNTSTTKGLTKEQAKVALEKGEMIRISTLFASGTNRIYVNCSEDCCRDDFDSFEEFWDSWGGEFEIDGEML